MMCFLTSQLISSGESPSSSASDVDNLNTQVIGERAALPRGASHVAGNHVIASRSRTSFVRLLDFVSKFITVYNLLVLTKT